MFPILFLHSAETNMAELRGLDPFNISNITILTPKKAKKLLGDKGYDGAVYVTTIKAAKLRNWIFFKEKSGKYNQLLNSPQADTIVQYVLNGHPLTDSTVPGKLFVIDNKNFKWLHVVDKENEKTFYVTTKWYIILIKATHPNKGLIKISKSG